PRASSYTVGWSLCNFAPRSAPACYVAAAIANLWGTGPAVCGKGLMALRRHSRAKGLTARNRAIPTTRFPPRHSRARTVEDLAWDQAYDLSQTRYSCLRGPGTLAQTPFPHSGNPLVSEETQQVADCAVWWESLGHAALKVGQHRLEHLPAGAWWGRVAEAERIGLGKKIGILIGGSADHDAIDMPEMHRSLHESRDTAVDLDAQRGEVSFQPIHVSIAQWWYGSVFPWTQAM